MTELETIQRAKMYLEQLANGIDPLTAQEIPGDSVLNNVRLSRCFFYVAGILDKVIANDGYVGIKPKVKLANFSLTPQQRACVPLSDTPVRITEFVEILHRAANAPDMRKLPTTAITNWLLEKGFLVKEASPDGKSRRLPTSAGQALGLSVAVRQGLYGEYTAVYYNRSAQQFLLDNLDTFLQEN